MFLGIKTHKKILLNSINAKYKVGLTGTMPKPGSFNSYTIQSYLFKDTKKSIVYISDTFKTGYKKIITSYKVISSNKNENTSILDINLQTGRTHQIRAHLAHLGYPIIGDGKYGNNQINKRFNEKAQLLCSYYIKFNFSHDSGILNYLKGREIILNDIPFIN